MRPANREGLVKEIDRALKNWGEWHSINDMQLTWEVYINLYLDRLTPSQQELVRRAKLGVVEDNGAWKWMVDDLVSYIWKHLRDMKEL